MPPMRIVILILDLNTPPGHSFPGAKNGRPPSQNSEEDAHFTTIQHGKPLDFCVCIIEKPAHNPQSCVVENWYLHPDHLARFRQQQR